MMSLSSSPKKPINVEMALDLVRNEINQTVLGGNTGGEPETADVLLGNGPNQNEQNIKESHIQERKNFQFEDTNSKPTPNPSPKPKPKRKPRPPKQDQMPELDNGVEVHLQKIPGC